MKQYQDLLRHVMNHGVNKSDRTGTGTRSVFGWQMRFDLNDGFPLVTTKKMFVQGMIDELLWFLSGSTNYLDLPKRTQQWWSPWADEDGNLGSIYGEQYRRSKWFFEVEPLIFEPNNPEIKAGLFCGVGDLGSMRRKPHEGQSNIDLLLKNTWRDMVKRCYSKTNSGYKSYGMKGVHMCDEWLNFENFYHDAQTLIGWEMKLEYPSEFSLDKDILFASNRYSKETCMWASRREQSMNTSTNNPFTAVSPEGKEVIFTSEGEICRDYGLNVSAVHRCLNGRLHTHHKWSNFKYILPTTGKVIRFREVDQLKLAITTIKHDPDSRRHLINLWHTPSMQHANLPCCHGSVVQFDVTNGKLSTHVYQRSVDLLLGYPVNIASYALLTEMMAQVCGLEVGELVYSLGQVHIYSNHFEQVELQLSREPLPLPQMILNKNIDNIFDFTYDDFELKNYQHHAIIKAPVAV